MHEHPTQMLADFMTLDEVYGREGYKGKTFVYIGRGGACCAFSYAVACAMFGMNFKFITSYMTLDEAVSRLSPEEQKLFYQEVPRGTPVAGWSGAMPDDQKKFIRELYAKYNPQCTFTETEDVNEVKGADVVSTENWGFFTNKAITWLPGIVKYKKYQVNRELMAKTENPNAIFLHMLPATHNADHSAARKLVDSVDDPELKKFLEKGFEVTDRCSRTTRPTSSGRRKTASTPSRLSPTPSWATTWRADTGPRPTAAPAGGASTNKRKRRNLCIS